jgi:hypothetical protein
MHPEAFLLGLACALIVLLTGGPPSWPPAAPARVVPRRT